MPLDFTDDKSTLVQVMAWYRQADLCRHKNDIQYDSETG